MKTIIILLSLGFTSVALANAKMSLGAVMETEQVEAVIQGDTATVKGWFRFRPFSIQGKDAWNNARVFFPLALPKAGSSSAADFKFSMRINGHELASFSIATNAPVVVPASDDYAIVWLSAKAPSQPSNRLIVEVSYQQKLVDGVFYYLPILEDSRPRSEAHQVRVRGDRPIRSVGKETGGVIVKGGGELIFTPADRIMIAVSVEDVSTKREP